MTQGAMPNPVELFSKASSSAQGVLAGVKQDQTNSPTPCSEWDVQALMNHIVGGAQYLKLSLAGTPPPAGSAPPPPETDVTKLASNYGSLTAEVLQLAANPATLEVQVATPAGEMSAGQFMGILFMDHLVHSWDLAKATGQSAKLDPELAEICYQMCNPGIIEMAREHGAFGPAVVVPDSASTQDKLLGYLGRQP
jgi:uncharacterized protein (TIGR03086 family)